MKFVEASILAPPPSRAIEAVELEFAKKLPSSYLAFMNRFNGAEPIDHAFLANGIEYGIEFFLPLLDNVANHDRGWAEVSVVGAQIGDRLTDKPDDYGYPLIPIASLYAGNFLVLDYRKSATHPAIAAWDHERSEEYAPYATVLAPSFEAFLELAGLNERQA